MLRRGKLLLQNVGMEAESYSLEGETVLRQKILEAAAPDAQIYNVTPEEWAKKSTLSIDFTAQKLAGGEDFSLQGTLKAIVPTYCARCMTEVLVERNSQFQLFIKLVTELERDEVDSGDPDLIYLEHPDFDLTAPFAEQLMILEPYAEIPVADYQGVRHICEEIQEFQAGQEESFKASSPFSKLAQLKQGES